MDNSTVPRVQYPLYFGCWGIPGAPCLWDVNRRIVPIAEAGLGPRVLDNMDGGFCPGVGRGFLGLTFPPLADQHEFQAKWWFDGQDPKTWVTVLSFWDRTCSPWPNSSSTFIARGLLKYEELLYYFSEHFPDIWRRFAGREIVVVP